MAGCLPEVSVPVFAQTSANTRCQLFFPDSSDDARFELNDLSHRAEKAIFAAVGAAPDGEFSFSTLSPLWLTGRFSKLAALLFSHTVPLVPLRKKAINLSFLDDAEIDKWLPKMVSESCDPNSISYFFQALLTDWKKWTVEKLAAVSDELLASHPEKLNNCLSRFDCHVVWNDTASAMPLSELVQLKALEDPNDGEVVSLSRYGQPYGPELAHYMVSLAMCEHESLDYGATGPVFHFAYAKTVEIDGYLFKMVQTLEEFQKVQVFCGLAPRTEVPMAAGRRIPPVVVFRKEQPGFPLGIVLPLVSQFEMSSDFYPAGAAFKEKLEIDAVFKETGMVRKQE